MKVNRNISAVLVNEQLLRNENSLSESLQRLSSGFKFNHAKDSPSGVAISYKMQAQINALDRASANTTDGISIVQTIDASIGEMNDIGQRIRELCVQAANDTNTQSDKEAIQLEVDALKQEIDRISRDTEFNGKSLLDGSLDRRTYVTNEDKSESYYEEISNVIISDGVESDSYQIDIKSSGTRTTVESGNGTLGKNDKITSEMAGTVTINGMIAFIDAGMTNTDVFYAIQTAASQACLDLTSSSAEIGNKLTFTQQPAGVHPINISCSNDALYSAIFGSQLNETVTGKDAELELVSDNFTSEATVFKDGNEITIHDRSGFEMSFEICDDVTSSGSYDATAGALSCYIEASKIGTLQLQIGTNEGQEIGVRVPVLNTKSLHISNLDVSKVDGAANGITQMDKALAQISAARSKMGSYQNALEFAQKSLDANNEDMTTAISRLEDTDMAKEMTKYTSYNVLDQASISILAQANDMPKQILSLLQF